jgi:hypothetical protein
VDEDGLRFDFAHFDLHACISKPALRSKIQHNASFNGSAESALSITNRTEFIAWNLKKNGYRRNVIAKRSCYLDRGAHQNLHNYLLNMKILAKLLVNLR